MHAINDPHDDLLLSPRDTTVVTQATAQNDTFPEPYDVEEGMTVLSGLSGVQSASDLRRRPNRQLNHGMGAKMRANRGRGFAAFLPMSGLGGVESATDMRGAPIRDLDHGLGIKDPTLKSRGYAPFLPGMGDMEGQKAAPARMRTKVRARGQAAGAVNVVHRRRVNGGGGPFPGVGAFEASSGVMLAVGAVALYFLLRK
jgi:hypothetical protein